MPLSKKYRTFKAFYPFYLSQHRNKICRLLHVIGSLGVLVILAIAITFKMYKLLWLMPIAGYGFAWIGHFFFEHNKPATFTYPWYSFLGDWVMLKDILTRKLKL